MYKALVFVLVIFLDLEIFGIKLDNALIATSLIFMLPWKGFSLFKYYIPLVISAVILLFLFLYSFFIRNNNLSDILVFIRPILVLLLVRWLSTGFNEIWFVKFTAIFFIFYVLLYILTVGRPEIGWALSSLIDSLDFEVRNGIPRLLWKLIVLIHLLQSYVLFKMKRTFWSVLLFLLSLIVIYLSGSFGLFVGSLVFVGVAWFRSFRSAAVLIVLTLGMICILPINELYERKAYSIMLKTDQVLSISTLDLEDLMLGKGMGSRFQSMDSRSSTDLYLEVSPIMLIINYGVIGGILMAMIYFILPVTMAMNYLELRWLIFAQIAILFSSFSNPYIWSGFVGLLVPLLIYRHAYIYNNSSLR